MDVVLTVVAIVATAAVVETEDGTPEWSCTCRAGTCQSRLITSRGPEPVP